MGTNGLQKSRMVTESPEISPCSCLVHLAVSVHHPPYGHRIVLAKPDCSGGDGQRLHVPAPDVWLRPDHRLSFHTPTALHSLHAGRSSYYFQG